MAIQDGSLLAALVSPFAKILAGASQKVVLSAEYEVWDARLQMGLADARAHVAACSELAGLFPRGRDWLGEQAARPPEEQHPLYQWLETPDVFPQKPESMAALCAALRLTVPGARSRCRRLWVGDPSDHHSAYCELYMAAALDAAGFQVRLGTPDITVEQGGDRFYLELTSARKTESLAALLTALRAAFSALPAGVDVVAASEALLLTTAQRRAIVAAAVAVATRALGTRMPVPLTGIVGPRDLRLEIVPSQPYVNSYSGGFHSGADAMPTIEAALAQKRSGLARFEPAILAVELTGSDWGSYHWAVSYMGRSLPGVSEPTLQGLVGVLAYWQSPAAHRPYMLGFLENDAWAGPMPRLAMAITTALRD